MKPTHNLLLEKVPPGEMEEIEEMIDMMREFLERKYPQGETLRHFHPKMHGCLKAQFIVEPNLATKYRCGLFSQPNNYDAWLRYSNAPPNKGSDKKRSGRGLAIKVLNVNGEIIDPDPIGVKCQNFLMTTSPVLSPGHVANYKRAIKALVKGFPTNLPYVLDPTNWRRIYLTLKNMKKHLNLLDINYFSGSPFLFGDTVVKFGVSPSESRPQIKPVKPTDYFLQERLLEDLKKQDVYLNFNVQFRTDNKKEPVEDTSVEWKSPFVKIATIKIQRQHFSTQQRVQFGENLVFSPWQCLTEHRPLGGINRARREVYKALSEYRLKQNGVDVVNQGVVDRAAPGSGQ